MRKLLILYFFVFSLGQQAFAQPDPDKMMRGAKLEEAAPMDAIVIGVNETAGSVAQPGWPVIVSAAVVSEKEPAPGLPKNLTLHVTDANGAVVPMSFEPVTRPAGSDETQAYWISTANNLPPGEYSVGAAAVSGFTVEAGDLTVEPANAESAASLGLLQMQLSVLTGKEDEALAQAGQLTTDNPNDVDAWIAKGDLLMGKDLPDEAIEAYQKAKELLGEDEDSLFLEERRRAAFFRSLEKRGVLTTTGTL